MKQPINKRLKEEKSVSEIIRMIAATPQLSKGFKASKVVEAWHEVMGQGVNSYTTEVTLKGDVLYVYLKSSVLRQELQLGKTKILDMLADYCGERIAKELILR
jgi:hypothetical protein